MSNSGKELQVLERLFRNLSQDKPQGKLSGLSDLFVRIHAETGEVALFGDDDELIASTVIFSWVGKDGKAIDQMKQSLREVISKLEHEGYWEHEVFERPFSIVLVDDEFVSIEELLFVDDELVQLTTPLLSNLDEDLGQFISELLKN